MDPESRTRSIKKTKGHSSLWRAELRVEEREAGTQWDQVGAGNGDKSHDQRRLLDYRTRGRGTITIPVSRYLATDGPHCIIPCDRNLGIPSICSEAVQVYRLARACFVRSRCGAADTSAWLSFTSNGSLSVQPDDRSRGVGLTTAMVDAQCAAMFVTNTLFRL